MEAHRQHGFIDSPSWWDEMVKEHGVTPAASDLSIEGQMRRLGTAVRMAGADLRTKIVLDAPCGVGLLDIWHGPFGGYRGIDYSANAVAKALGSGPTKARIVQQGDMLATWGDRDKTWAELIPFPVDWSFCIGLTTFKNSTPLVDIVDKVMVPMFQLSVEGMVMDFPTCGMQPSAKISPAARLESIDDVVHTFYDRYRLKSRSGPLPQIDIRTGHVDHEFLVCIRR